MSNVFTIGIDLDTTLIKSTLLEQTSKELHFNFKEQAITDWELTCLPPKLRHEMFKRFHSPYYMCDNKFISPVKNSQKILSEWKSKGHKLILISARCSNIRTETKKVVKKMFPAIFDKILFVEIGTSKRRKFKSLKLTHWIDDNPKDCKSAVNFGINTYLISNNQTKYNWGVRKYKNINVVNSVTDIII